MEFKVFSTATKRDLKLGYHLTGIKKFEKFGLKLFSEIWIDCTFHSSSTFSPLVMDVRSSLSKILDKI